MDQEQNLRPMTIEEATAEYGTELFAASVIRALLSAPITLPDRPAVWGEINPIHGMAQGWLLSIPKSYTALAHASVDALAERIERENADARAEGLRPKKRSREELANLLSALIRTRVPTPA